MCWDSLSTRPFLIVNNVCSRLHRRLNYAGEEVRSVLPVIPEAAITGGFICHCKGVEEKKNGLKTWYDAYYNASGTEWVWVWLRCVEAELVMRLAVVTWPSGWWWRLWSCLGTVCFGMSWGTRWHFFPDAWRESRGGECWGCGAEWMISFTYVRSSMKIESNHCLALPCLKHPKSFFQL